MGLTSVFLLGMAVNLIGLPAGMTGAAHVASIAFLAALRQAVESVAHAHITGYCTPLT
jgi:hypothetical protein